MSSRAARKRLRRKAEPQPFIRIDGETVATMGDVSITFRGGTFVDASGQTFSQDAEGRVYLVGARPIAGEYTVAEIARRSAYGWTEAPIGIVTDVSPEDPTRVGVQLNGATFFDEAHPYTPPVPGSFSNWLPDTGQRLPVAPTLCRIHDECRRGAEEGPRNHGRPRRVADRARHVARVLALERLPRRGRAEHARAGAFYDPSGRAGRGELPRERSLRASDASRRSARAEQGAVRSEE